MTLIAVSENQHIKQMTHYLASSHLGMHSSVVELQTHDPKVMSLNHVYGHLCVVSLSKARNSNLLLSTQVYKLVRA